MASTSGVRPRRNRQHLNDDKIQEILNDLQERGEDSQYFLPVNVDPPSDPSSSSDSEDEDNQAEEPASRESRLYQVPGLANVNEAEPDLPDPPPVPAVDDEDAPPPPKRPRGRPAIQRAPVVPPPPPMRPPTPPPVVDAITMRQFRAQSKANIARIKSYPKKMTAAQGRERWDLLLEDEEQRNIHCGTWQWDDCVEDEPSINDDILFDVASQGMSLTASRCTDESDFFRLFLTTPALDNLVKQTNIYAVQKEARGFTPVSRNSILAYIGVTIAMGLVPKTDLEKYWSTDEVISTSFFGKVMSRKVFQQHQSCLHVADTKKAKLTADGKFSDKLYEVRPLLDTIVRSSHDHYRPGRELSIDEMMIGTKCRIGFIQYMKDKPTKWSIKVWALCDAEIHYCLNFDVYTAGSSENSKGLTFNVVNQLMSQYLEKGHHLYIDNFYTSPTLLDHLLEHNTLCVGTVRNNRKHMPERFKTTVSKIGVGEAIFAKSHKMTVCRWMDKRDVFVLSTVHGKSTTEITRTKSGKGNRGQQEVIQKPTAICDYNMHMGGVDVFDQLLSYHPIVRRYKRWWLKVFWRLIDIAILNSFALWKLKHNTGTARDLHFKFRLALVKQLVRPYMNDRAALLVPPIPFRQQHDRLLHTGYPMKHATKRICCVCKNKTQTFHGCQNCPDVRVHHSECFYLLHSAVEPHAAFLALP